MFGWRKGGGGQSQLAAADVARWLAKHAREVKSIDRESGILFFRASMALDAEQERHRLLVGDTIRQ
jgi:hypothetical protein